VRVRFLTRRIFQAVPEGGFQGLPEISFLFLAFIPGEEYLPKKMYACWQISD
jgi:hypothetical protein